MVALRNRRLEDLLPAIRLRYQLQPLQQQLGPLRGRESVFDALGYQVADAVGSLVEDLQMHGHAEFFQVGLDRFRQLDRRAAADAVVRGVHEKHGRTVFAKREGGCFLSLMPGGESHGEVGTAALAFHRVGCLLVSRVEVGGQVHRQIGARRVADDADLVGINVPFLGPLADQSHGPFGIEQRNLLNARVVDPDGAAAGDT
jgi:hypothetical protein